ncbi:MAG: PatB family C-S lyase [Thermodesulfobacteriota bacterium]
MADFDTVPDRADTGSLKWWKYAGTTIRPMWVADMDFPSPACILAALRQRIDHGVFGYTVVPQGLPATVVAWLWRRYRWRIEPGWLVWIPGLVAGLNLACRALLSPGEEALALTPVYPPFLTAAEHNGGRTVRVELADRAAGWRIDFAALERAITAKSRLLLLCHPHNPVGRVWTGEELAQLLDLCRRHDLFVCSDEIHCDLLLEPAAVHLPFAGLDEDAGARTITLMAPSKTFNIPGLGCSFAVIADPALRRRFRAAMAGLIPEVNLFGFTAAEAAYRDGGPWLEELIAYLRGNRDLVEGRVGDMPGVRMHHVEATYLAWLDVRGLGLPHPAPFFEVEAGVGLSDGADFGAPGYLRLNFACPRRDLDAALSRMEAAVRRRA